LIALVDLLAEKSD